MKVFLDTNVLVAAFATRGLCSDVLREVMAEHEFVISELVLSELEKALSKKIGLQKHIIDTIVSLLRHYAVNIRIKKKMDLQISDPNDDKILSSAVAAGVDVFVTGDQELLAIEGQIGILITSPRGFWDLLRKR